MSDNVHEWPKGAVTVGSTRTTQSDKVAGGSEPPDIPNMESRVSKLEGSFETFRALPPIFLGVIALVVTIMIGGFAFLGTQLSRVEGRVDRVEAKLDSLSARVDALPDKINANLRDLTGALSQAITAARQQAPQVILVPAPQSGTGGNRATEEPTK